MKIQLQLILAFLLFSITGIGQSTVLTEQSGRAEWSILKNDAFEIRHPADWEVNESGLMGTSFLLFSPLSDQMDTFKDNVNLIMQDVSGYNLTLEKYIEISLQQLPSMVAESNVLLSETVVKEDKTFQKMIYTGKQGQFDLKFEQYISIINEQVYILTLTCEVDTFDQFQAVGERILDSFEVTK